MSVAHWLVSRIPLQSRSIDIEAEIVTYRWSLESRLPTFTLTTRVSL